jgi:uncharacterized protein (TIGR02597 family)
MIRPIKLFAALAALPVAVLAQSVNTDPVGFVTLTTLSNSDTIFSTPLARAEAFRGSVGSLGSVTVTATNSTVTVTAGSTPGWTASAFVYVSGTQSNTYYLRFRTGAKAGSYFTVTANTTDTLTLDLAGDLITGATAGDEFALIPYWTLGTVLPPSAVGTAFEASGTVGSRKTEIFFPDSTSAGINLAPSATYFFLNSAWRKFGSLATISFNDAVLVPDSYVKIRNKAFTGSFSVTGTVPTKPQASPVTSLAASKQDNFVAVSFPVPVALRDLGLFTSSSLSSAVRESASVGNRIDEIFVFDNAVAGINKAPSATYYYRAGAWRKFGSLITQDFGGDLLQPGSGVILRRGVDTAGPRSINWTYTPPTL